MMKLRTSVLLLSQLATSPLNARAEAEYDADKINGLADSIEALGLLQPIVVHDIGKNKYGVLAGGRRFAALTLLVEAGRIGSNESPEIDVMIADGTDAELREASITENFVREPMTDVQIYRAVKATRDDNSSVNLSDEQLAMAFGVGVARMRRILRLAFIHPDILAAYEAGDMDAAALQAYGRSDDLEKQKEIFDAQCELPYNKHIVHQIVSFYGFNNRDHKRLLAYVTAAAYAEAGGRLEHDLFGDESEARIIDDSLLFDMADTKLKAQMDALREQHPDLEVVTEAPMVDGYIDYNLKARESYPDEDARERAAQIRNDRDLLFEELVELVALPEDAGAYHEDDEIYEARAKKGMGKEATAVRKKIDKLSKESEKLEASKCYPAQATWLVCTLGSEGELTTARWFPDRAAAGFSDREAKAKAKAKADAPPVDPANPALTQRAEAFTKAERYLMVIEHVTDDGAASQRTAGMAHVGLIFRMARKLLLEGLNDHGVDRELGDVFSFQGVGSEVRRHPDYKEILAGVPGLTNDDEIAGFNQFMEVDNDMLDRVAGLIFAVKAWPTAGPEDALVNHVFEDLSEPSYARRAWYPTFEFFDLFKKDTILDWFGSIDPQYKLDRMKDKVAELKENAVTFFTANEESAKRFGMPPGSVAKANAWVPPMLKWLPEKEGDDARVTDEAPAEEEAK